MVCVRSLPRTSRQFSGEPANQYNALRRMKLIDSEIRPVILDLMLPDGSGLEVLRAIRNSNRRFVWPTIPTFWKKFRHSQLERVYKKPSPLSQLLVGETNRVRATILRNRRFSCTTGHIQRNPPIAARMICLIVSGIASARRRAPTRSTLARNAHSVSNHDSASFRIS
jgi:hypothetical protein